MRGLARRLFCQGLGAMALSIGCRPHRPGGEVVRPRDPDDPRQRLLLRGARIYTERGLQRLDLRARGGRITELAPALEPQRGETRLDATGLLALPGGIDPHVHLSSAATPPDEDTGFCDNYTHGSEAALAGGLTSIGAMIFPDEHDDILGAVETHTRSVAEQAIADVFMHAVAFTSAASSQAALATLERRGHTSIKLFKVMVQFERQRSGFVEIIREAGRRRMLTLLHCENHQINDEATHRLIAEGKNSLRYFAESSPVRSEVKAVRDAIYLAEQTGAPVYVVHLSSAAALTECVAARRRGLPVYVETRPMYLYHTRARYERADGPLFVGQPPLRGPEDIEALWDGLRRGLIDTIGSDHAPFTAAEKLDPLSNLEEYRPGTPSLQMMLPMLFSEGVARGRITLSRFVELTSTNAARLFGLYPRKGVIRRGADADLTLWDPGRRQTIDVDMLRSRAGYDINEGREVLGWPIYTIRRGELAYADGEITAAPGSGRLLARGPHQPLR